MQRLMYAGTEGSVYTIGKPVNMMHGYLGSGVFGMTNKTRTTNNKRREGREGGEGGTGKSG
tara:strand:- start:5135 stop:5317 length:183 start_codon:yes stop_codon:yes gene_type:complete